MVKLPEPVGFEMVYMIDFRDRIRTQKDVDKMFLGLGK